MRRKESRFQKENYIPSRELKISTFDDSLKVAIRDNERRDIEECYNNCKESFLIEIRFLTRNDDLRKLAGNWATCCTCYRRFSRAFFWNRRFFNEISFTLEVAQVIT